MILITGGGGNIGRATAKYLIDTGEEVLLLQRNAVDVPDFLEAFWGKQAKGALGNILDLPFLLGLVKDYQVESIIHTAGMWENRTGEGTLHQVLQVATQGTMNVMEAARIFGLRRVTFTSSIGVYHGSEGSYMSMSEDSLLPPVSFSYIGNTKKMVEQMLLLYTNDYGLSAPSVRVGGVYGPPVRRVPWTRSAIVIMVANAVAGKPSDHPDLSPNDYNSSPIYSMDNAKGIGLIHMAKSLKHYHYNLAEGKAYSWAKIVQAIKEVIPDADIRLGPAKPEEKAEKPRTMSIDRIKEELGFAPDYDLKRGIKAYIDWLREGS